MRPFMSSVGIAAALFVSLSIQSAMAQSPAAAVVNLVELVVIPAELPKFLEIAKENAVTVIKEPGVRAFNILQLASNPNHVVFYEVYDNQAALAAHRASDHFKTYQASIAKLVADGNARTLTSIELPSSRP
jgi:quinol monooxygenase YgiN